MCFKKLLIIKPIYMYLKSILLFYLSILTPLTLLVVFANSMSSRLFIISILIYGLVYHPLMCGIRLIQMEKISSKDFFKNFIPFWNKKYFDTLFLGA